MVNYCRFMGTPKGEIPSGTYEVKLGATWDPPGRNKANYHTLKYDFKPKSVTNESETYIGLGQNGDVQVAMPGDNDSLTLYKGSQKPVKEEQGKGPKECLLFYNPKTGEVRIEKVATNISVKRTRDAEPAIEAHLRAEISRLRTCSTSAAPPPTGMRSSSSNTAAAPAALRMGSTSAAPPPPPVETASSAAAAANRERKRSSSSSSSSSSSDSSSEDSDEEDFKKAPTLTLAPAPPQHQQHHHQPPAPVARGFSNAPPSIAIPPPSLASSIGLSAPPPAVQRTRTYSESSNMEMSSDDEMTAQIEQAVMASSSARASPPAPIDSMPSLDSQSAPFSFQSRPMAAASKERMVMNDLALSESSDEDD